VGIDRAVPTTDKYNSNGVLQVGTDYDAQGTPYAWLEAYPASRVPLPLTIRVGDQVSMTIVRQGQ
jgi:hypothetical protein